MAEIFTSRRAPSMLWGTMIISGTIVGAGMFTLPIVMAGAWYFWSGVLLLIAWGSMLMSGLLFLEANLNYPLGSGYDTLTRDLLGRRWSIINGLSIAFVLGILAYAYISASGPVLKHSLNSFGLNVSVGSAKVLFTLCVAVLVWFGTAMVGRMILLCLGAKLITFFSLFGGLLKQVDTGKLFNAVDHHASYLPYTLMVLPFCLASFGFHGNIAGLVAYYRQDVRRVVGSLLLGTLLALAIYLIWLTGTMGNISRHDFPAIAARGGDVEALISTLRPMLHIPYLNVLLEVFSHFAVACSFLGVTLGLFDYLADRLGWGNAPLQRLKTVILTFGPPLAFSLLFPDGFLYAIGFAGLLATLWAVFTPALVALRARQRFVTMSWRLRGGVLPIILVLLFGIANVVVWIMTQFGWLPVYK
ncbi:tryptophan permease [Photorhabdus noenieputensis]|uniref:tryptophan permease n=1 Tax=Photorhabdus TaxID=29487 RepID=UPI001BD6585A|nr:MULTISPECIES: tryptophan permease [Photorhabdus]MBS9425198.1 tryptophan permease [Photorhabdus caribbeanensis]MBS9437726.1 tryptophan permease [Photorhabdus noenieputensis]MCK3667876.1 tryptophan permease [Photorhabdus noenieputensis]